MVSMVGPQEVYVIPTEYDDQTSVENEPSETSDASSWETADNDERGSCEIPEEGSQTKAENHALGRSKSENNDEPIPYEGDSFGCFDILGDAPLDHNFLGEDGQKSNEKQRLFISVISKGYHSKIGTAEGEKNSLGYNENAFLLNCKTMISLMRSPLEGFEELIREHFKRRGDDIMKTCDTKVTSVETSQGFKQTMGKLRKELFSLLK